MQRPIGVTAVMLRPVVAAADKHTSVQQRETTDARDGIDIGQGCL